MVAGSVTLRLMAARLTGATETGREDAAADVGAGPASWHEAARARLAASAARPIAPARTFLRVDTALPPI
jgi:hypothetical protein